MKSKLTKISMCAMMALSCTPVSAEGDASQAANGVTGDEVVSVQPTIKNNASDGVNTPEVAPIVTPEAVQSTDMVPMQDLKDNVGTVPGSTPESTPVSTPTVAPAENSTDADSETKIETAPEVADDVAGDDVMPKGEGKEVDMPTELSLKAAPSKPEITERVLMPGQAIEITLKFDVKLDAESKARMEREGWKVRDYSDGTHKLTQTFVRNVIIDYNDLKAEDGQPIPAFKVSVSLIDEVAISTTINFINSAKETVKSETFNYEATSIPAFIIDGRVPEGYVIKDKKDVYEATVDETNDQLIATKQHLNIDVVTPEELISATSRIEFNDRKDQATAIIELNCFLHQDSIRDLLSKGYDVATNPNGGAFGTGVSTIRVGGIKQPQTIQISGLKSKEGYNIPEIQVKVDGFAKANISIVGLTNHYVISEKPVEFSVTTNQTGLNDKMVRVKLDRHGATQEDVKIEYLEPKDGKWYELTGNFFGPENGFPFINGTSKFRATFLKDTQGKTPYEFSVVVVDAKDVSIEYTQHASTGQIRVDKNEVDSASMDIELDKTGPYTVGDTVKMTITTHASGKYKGMMVKGAMTSNFDSSKVYAEYEENGVWKELKGDSFGGNGFPLIDGLKANFRFTFKEAGDYNTTINLVEAKEGGEVVATNKLTAKVNPKEVNPNPNPNPDPKPDPKPESKPDSKPSKKPVSGWDDGGPFTTNAEGDVFDRWGNLIYDAPDKTNTGSNEYGFVDTSDK